MKQTILIFSGLTVAVLVLLRLNKFSLASGLGSSESSWSLDIMVIISAAIFVIIGLLLSRLFKKSATNDADVEIDMSQLAKIGLSNREYEILVLMAKGDSNNDIASKLFISENTVKTHVSRILSKLNAKRRTHAVQIARDLGILIK